MRKPAVFISYRRDDCPGYAGRLEETLERALGSGTVFRDVRDIAIGTDFAKVIKSQLQSAHTALVLIGPRWMGTHDQGGRRIDELQDFVRLEVSIALTTCSKVIPVLLGGVSIPQATELPEDLKELPNKQALRLDEENWESDVQRLIEAVGLPSKARRNLLFAGSALAAIGIAAAAGWSLTPHPRRIGNDLIGTWQAPVRYDWGDRSKERFVFERFAGKITGTASFLTYPLAIEQLVVRDNSVEFFTRSNESVNGEQREVMHRYVAELQNNKLRIRMHTTGGFSISKPVEFEARRIATPQLAN